MRVVHFPALSWMKPPWFDELRGVSLPCCILVKDWPPPRSLLRHERAHEKQLQRVGLWMFYALYLYEWCANLAKGQGLVEAYRNIQFEVEARRAETGPRRS